jgi:hypothetical protein
MAVPFRVDRTGAGRDRAASFAPVGREGGFRAEGDGDRMIDVRRATTTEEREAIYRFRYAVYVEEMGRYTAAADHEHRRLVDPEDDNSWNYFAHDGSSVVASHRCTWGGLGFSVRQIGQYGLQPFLDELPARVLFVGERTMVAASHRGTSVGAELAQRSTLPVPADDLCVVFGACEPHLISYYARLATVPYAPRNINSDESGYLVPLISFPRGIGVLDDLGSRRGTPRCIQRVIDGACAVTSSAIVGERAYWERFVGTLRDLRARPGSLFEGFTDVEIRRCVARSSVIDCAAGDRVLKRNGTAHNVFVVLGGELEARDGATVIGGLGPGDVFGETAFLLGRPRTLDVYAVAPGTRILSLSERVLREVMSEHPRLASRLLVNISKVLCERSASGIPTGKRWRGPDVTEAGHAALDSPGRGPDGTERVR